jgi:hypothetical protein
VVFLLVTFSGFFGRTGFNFLLLIPAGVGIPPAGKLKLFHNKNNKNKKIMKG